MQSLLRPLASLLVVTLGSAVASAQTAPAASATGTAPAQAPPPPAQAAPPPPAQAAPPPPAQAAPPPRAGYGYPYAGYPYSRYPYPYPGYPPAARPAPSPRYLPYHQGQRIPAGYHLEDNIRRGPAIAGAVTLGAPYVISLAFALGYSFDNKSGWLALPAVGPFITAAARHDTCPSSTSAYSGCTDDPTLRMLLTLDGLAQSAGAVLLIWGLTSHTKRLVREDARYLVVMPTRIGTGYGLGVAGNL